MTAPPLITIGIPTYNRGKFLRETLASARVQASKDIEILVVDDGSTDDTSEILSSISDPLLRTVKKENTGAPDTRNRVIQEMRGEYLLWLDSDDLLAPGCLDAHRRAIADFPDADILYGDLIAFGKTGEDRGDRKPIAYEDYYRKNDALIAGLIMGNRIPNPGTIIRRELFERIGVYNTDFKRAHDYEFWIRAASTAVFKHVGHLVLYWRWHDSNMSSESVQYDCKYEVNLIDTMCSNFPLEMLFPSYDWKHIGNASISAYFFFGSTDHSIPIP